MFINTPNLQKQTKRSPYIPLVVSFGMNSWSNSGPKILKKFLKASLELNQPFYKRLVEMNLIGILEELAKSPLQEKSDAIGKHFFSKTDGF